MGIVPDQCGIAFQDAMENNWVCKGMGLNP